MKRLLRCEEWSKLRVGPGCELDGFEDITSILDAWKRNTGSDTAGHFEVQANSLVPKFWSGILSTPKFDLEVSPIGSLSLEAPLRAHLDANISTMLATARSSQSLSAGLASLSSEGGRYDALIRMFCDDLRIARRRQVIRKYVALSDSLPCPRGRISFPSQCYENIRRPGRFSSNWVELSEDVPENRIFKEVLLRFRPRCSSSIRGIIDLCLSEFDAVDISRGHRLEWPQVRMDRLPAYYITLLEQARALLEAEGVGIFHGARLAVSEIVFTSSLFEQFVAKELAWLATAHSQVVKIQERGNFLCSRRDGRRSFEVIPDVRLVDGRGRTTLILDTKWKPLQHQKDSLGISRTDIHQVLVYATKFECNDIVLLYPDVNPSTGATGFYDRFTVPLAGQVYRIHVAKMPLLASSLRPARSFLDSLFGYLDLKRPITPLVG